MNVDEKAIIEFITDALGDADPGRFPRIFRTLRVGSWNSNKLAVEFNNHTFEISIAQTDKPKTQYTINLN